MIRTRLLRLLSSSFIVAAWALLSLGCQAQDAATEDADYYAIMTPMGRMVVELYDATPLHRAAFQQAASAGTYDTTLFHRVIPGFMIQGGDPLSKDDNPRNDGQGDPWPDLVPAEIDTALIHRRGALAAARMGDQVNPERNSGGQFYIVQGRVFTDEELDMVEERVRRAAPAPDFAFSEEERVLYKTVGGAPFLDRQYTVFGQLVEGFDVLDRIASAPTDPRTNRPTTDVPMRITPLPDYTPPAE